MPTLRPDPWRVADQHQATLQLHNPGIYRYIYVCSALAQGPSDRKFYACSVACLMRQGRAKQWYCFCAPNGASRALDASLRNIICASVSSLNTMLRLSPPCNQPPAHCHSSLAPAEHLSEIARSCRTEDCFGLNAGRCRHKLQAVAQPRRTSPRTPPMCFCASAPLPRTVATASTALAAARVESTTSESVKAVVEPGDWTGQRSLVIVESPAKARKIQAYLGDDFTVLRTLQAPARSHCITRGMSSGANLKHISWHGTTAGALLWFA